MDTTYPLTLYYDGACPLCSAEMGYLRQRDVRGQLRFVDISIADAGFPTGATRDEMMRLMHAQAADGRLLRGVEVFRLAYSAVGLPWVAKITRLPGLGWLSEKLYPVIARNRYRLPSRPIAWLYNRAIQRAARATVQRAQCAGQCHLPSSTQSDGGKVQS